MRNPTEQTIEVELPAGVISVFEQTIPVQGAFAKKVTDALYAQKLKIVIYLYNGENTL